MKVEFGGRRQSYIESKQGGEEKQNMGKSIKRNGEGKLLFAILTHSLVHLWSSNNTFSLFLNVSLVNTLRNEHRSLMELLWL